MRRYFPGDNPDKEDLRKWIVRLMERGTISENVKVLYETLPSGEKRYFVQEKYRPDDPPPER